VSFIGHEIEAAAGGRGCTIVPPRSEFDFAVHDPEIEAVDEPAIAALLAKIRPSCTSTRLSASS
jgi:hypothetical protein